MQAIQPLRDLATGQDRHEAWRVAVARIDHALGAPALKPRTRPRRAPDMKKPALLIEATAEADDIPSRLVVERGCFTVIGAARDAPSTLLLAAAGIEPLSGARIRVFGRPPGAVPTGTVNYVGPASPIVRGSLRRNLLLGHSSRCAEERLLAVIQRVGLSELAARLGGLDGSIAEGGRNLGRLDAARLLVARAILGSALLMLIDAAGLALPQDCLDPLIDTARSNPATTVVVVVRERRVAEASRGHGTLHCSACGVHLTTTRPCSGGSYG